VDQLDEILQEAAQYLQSNRNDGQEEGEIRAHIVSIGETLNGCVKIRSLLSPTAAGMGSQTYFVGWLRDRCGEGSHGSLQHSIL
jgi:hypothetical protein